MDKENPNVIKEVLNGQKHHWEQMYYEDPEMFGKEPSKPAQKAAALSKKEGRAKILELGSGQGRDTFFFAKNNFQVTALDYTKEGIEAIIEKASTMGLSKSVKAISHDVRAPLPFAGESFDACYSHMLYCMALTTSELEFLSGEVKRVLKPGGLNIYTVRHTRDSHYGKGIHRGEDMYEVDGFIVDFFSREKVEYLAKGYNIIRIDEFKEGELPRKLFLVTLRKQEK